MSGFPLRDSAAVAAALVCPPVVAALLVPFRADLTSTNAARGLSLMPPSTATKTRSPVLFTASTR
ncbi:hypothetical protein GCM10015535_04220 [Streptomyces gelaticus]|uniref:Secreted protein n=1 Tax=Streptomyces gelaticus TaxID=285446 RepID=A0ABQ2VU74_9ACTN|nr:hypothetical protein [Streptomyces gelaticus]GGV74833.1 hypothetical protein GCM10015535_04220 [Streptomyces gelaticus]